MKTARLSLLSALFLLSAFAALLSAAEREYPGTKEDWHGFDCYRFTFEDRAALVVAPKETADGAPWVWRARFFGHEPQADLAMLGRGYHVAWLDSAPLMGSPKSVELWQRFYLYLTETLGLCRRVHLEGLSRGGLYTVNWAVKYPDETASIYIDNPVLDFKSWPGGFGKSPGSKGDWQDVLASYELTEEEALVWPGNPTTNPQLERLAAAKVPILIVCGDSDTVVPFDENEKPFIARYRGFGGPIEVIVKPGNDHHPHSLPDPKPIVDFFLKAQEKADAR
ncbi:MAG: alpha/beta hydrolase [Thermoguttaceae bacterium]|nr:alpha/beta hydrolase [Thermoguttaceae bacterium]